MERSLRNFFGMLTFNCYFKKFVNFSKESYPSQRHDMLENEAEIEINLVFTG